MPGTTCKVFNDYYLPSEGYVDSSGRRVEFKIPDSQSAVQHGGFFVSLNDFRILDFSELIEKQHTQSFKEDEYLIQANWYMSSDNFQEVSRRENLLERRPYNAIGFFSLQSGEKLWFSINGSSGSMLFRKRLFSDNTEWNGTNPKMVEIATLCERVKRSLKAVGWRVAGTEFNGGETHLSSLSSPDRGGLYEEIILNHRDYFLILKPVSYS